VGAVVGVARPGPGEGDLAVLAPVQQVVVDERLMNSLPLSLSMPGWETAAPG
jgi:hypothetical protein